MRVLLVTGSFPPMRCGVGDYTRHLAQALAARAGVQVGVLTSREALPSQAAESDAFFPVVEAWRLRDLPRILSVLRRWKPDIVHIQFPTQGYRGSRLPSLLPMLFRLAGFRVVQTWHEYHITSRPLLWCLTQMPVSGGVIVVRPRFVEMLSPLLRRTLSNKTWRFIPNAAVLPQAQLSAAERDRIREKFGRPGARLIAYFGFIYPAKGVDLLFRIADAQAHHLVIIGEVREVDDYHRAVLHAATSEPWTGKVTLAGFLPAEEAASVMAAADAVLLPFLEGGGEWNTSLQGAQAQGTFVITTSTGRHGYDADTNTYFASPGDVAEMRSALAQHLGRRSAPGRSAGQTWSLISEAHLELYNRVVAA